MEMWVVRALCLVHVVGGFSPPPPSLSLLHHKAQRPSLGMLSEKVEWVSGVAVGRVAVPRLSIHAKRGGEEGKDKEEDEEGKWKTNIRLVLDTICKKRTPEAWLSPHSSTLSHAHAKPKKPPSSSKLTSECPTLFLDVARDCLSLSPSHACPCLPSCLPPSLPPSFLLPLSKRTQTELRRTQTEFLRSPFKADSVCVSACILSSIGTVSVCIFLARC
jgi:hypothetical protein